jgi:hypothetical protein
MNDSELKQIWQEQKSAEPSPAEVERIARAVHSADRKFRRTIWWRDLREIGAALICAVVFGRAGETWLRWIAVTSCIFVAGYILKTRIPIRPRPEGLTLVDRIHQILRETESQIRLLRSVLWWYLLPIAIGTVAIILDRASVQGRSPRKFDPAYLVNFFVVMGLLAVAIYWLNQRAVRKCLEPRRARLQKMLSDLLQPT